MSLWLALRACGLSIDVPEKTTPTIYGQLKSMVTSTSSVDGKTGRRWIVVKKSPPFPRDKAEKPFKNTYVFDEIFRTDVYEGLSTQEDGIFPHLVAPCPSCGEDEDVNLWVIVYINRSDIKQNKDTILAQCFVSLRELINAAHATGAKGNAIHHYTHDIGMKSEYCTSPRVALNLIPPVDEVTRKRGSKVLPFAASRASDPSTLTPNPIEQRYVFYDEDAPTRKTPKIFVDERVYEPRCLCNVPIVYLESLATSISKSLQSWRQRRVFEFYRQGHFRSGEEAYKAGWFGLEVVVMSANIQRSELYEDQRESLLPKRPFVYHRPRRASGKKKSGMDCLPPIAVKKDLAHVRFPEVVLNQYKRERTTLADTSQPSSFVDVLVEDPAETFSLYLGRTNTEYHSFEPIYGSNLHANFAPKTPEGAQSLRAQSGGVILGTKDSTNLVDEEHTIYFDSFLVKESPPEKNAKGDKEREPMEVSEKNALDSWNEEKDVTSLVCTNTAFRRFIPRRESVNLTLLLNNVKGSNNGESERRSESKGGKGGKGKHGQTYPQPSTSLNKNCSDIVMGKGSISLRDLELGRWQEIVVPLDRVNLPGNAHVQYSTLTLKVKLSGKSDSDVTDRVPSSMPYSFSYDRQATGEHVASPESHEETFLPYTRRMPASSGNPSSVEETLSDCYEWLWHLGYLGRDPLSMDESSATVPGLSLLPRTDIFYPLDWLDQYITEMESLQMFVLDQVGGLKKLHAKETTFRASALKTEWDVQALPINVHTQLVAVKSFDRGSDVTPNDGAKEDTMLALSRSTPDSLIESISCGSFTAHAMGHKKGGLNSMKVDLLALSNKLESMKADLMQRVGAGAAGTGVAAVKEGSMEKARPFKESRLSPWGTEGRLNKGIEASVLSFEDLILPVAKRRLLCVSQILAVATNGLLNKLALLEEGHIAHNVARHWLSHGMLFMFECLLTMKGKERGMVEDTMTAVEALRDFKFKLCVEEAPPGVGVESEASVGLQGRVITVRLAESCFEMFPPEYVELVAEDKCFICIKAALFTQGLDMTQSMSTMTGEASKERSTLVAGATLMSSTDLQHHVNNSGLVQVNAYCHAVRPISSSTTSTERAAMYSAARRGDIEEAMAPAEAGAAQPDNPSKVHPLADSLEKTIRCTARSEKNVTLLIEVERLCYILSGCRVTFCKSGKDRTGMVVTLEQSRVFGERFGCGEDTERIINDARVMRVKGVRLQVCKKNIGKPVYSINQLQAQFLPPMLRPPTEAMEALFKKDNT